MLKYVGAFLCLNQFESVKELCWFVSRWGRLKVSSLNLNAPLTVHSSVTIQETLTILNKEGYDQVPVVNDMG